MGEYWLVVQAGSHTYAKFGVSVRLCTRIQSPSYIWAARERRLSTLALRLEKWKATWEKYLRSDSTGGTIDD